MAVVSGITTVSLSWRCFLIQEIVPFNTECRLREECVLSLAFVSEHLCAFFVSKVTSSSWLMLSKLNSLTGTTSMYRPVLVFLEDLCQAQKYYTFFLFCMWSCLLCGAVLSFGCHMVLHRLIQWAVDLVMKFGTWETLNLYRTGIFLTGTNVEQPSWVKWAIQPSNFQD